MKKLFALLMVSVMLVSITACAAAPAVEEAVDAAKEGATQAAQAVGNVVEGAVEGVKENTLPEIPAAEPDPDNMFGVDKNINVTTLDSWLGRDDVAYIDARMLIDPGCYEAICGDSVLSGTVEGFEVVPYPYLATLTGLPPEVAETQYDGDKLFTIEWDENGAIASVTANFVESEAVIHDLFPTDKAIFIMCGGGGYASFTKNLLVELGYDENLIYNVGGYWDYKGDRAVEIKTTVDGTEYNAFHRLDYHFIDFEQLHKVK